MPLRPVAHGALSICPDHILQMKGFTMSSRTLTPGRRGSQRVLLLQRSRTHATSSGNAFSTYFNAHRVASSRPRGSISGSFYTPSYTRRIVSTAYRAASVDAVRPTATFAPFPIQSHSIPPANEPLHTSLQELNNLAPDLVNQSRLQLALRGLESTSPTIRIAIVGLGHAGARKARRLARLLVADPLGNETESERLLVEADSRDERAVLLRYSQVEEENGFGGVRGGPENPLLRTVDVDSPILSRNGVEVLVAETNGNLTLPGQQSEDNALETALLPVLNSPLAGSGRAGFVRFPVHKAIVVAEGFDGALFLAEYTSRVGTNEQSMITTALDLSVSDKSLSSDAINVGAAEQALKDFRRDVGTGPRFSETWQSSGIGDLADVPKVDRTRALPLPLEQHITSILSSSEAAIERSQEAAERDVASRSVPEETREALQQAITSWSEYAHTDLQDTMAAAFASATWRRTSFPRVLWRIDDVSFSATQLLHSNFLVESETYLAFLIGRIGEAGFFNKTQTPPATPSSPAETAQAEFNPMQGLSPAQLAQTAEVRDKVKAQTGVDPFVRKPWPVGLTACRHSLLVTLVPALHARAQALVLQCLGLVGSTSALGIWYIVATAGTGIYEAGAIIGLGTVWALRRLQKVWGAERTKFEGEVKERGRLVLSEVEAGMRKRVRHAQRPQIRTEDLERWAQARQLVQKCRELLSKL
ncbi:hypothetical protein BDZ85DRAFT_266842 [Elsinoe ampelina]|uniref:Mmc1 C-terminal domain-containing protein n=1 Tax=Elsinoe ampelina TaxID=302913 RepID=A0A6A6G4Q3_9PEZI|nr:hypothetical protein BDZ85DRAFT_266842 [Elsinoe ampelina]